MIRRAARPVVVALLVAAAWVGLPAAPAHAAACTGSTGVTVVVDFNGLGGGVQGACVADGGGDTATDVFEAAGFPINDQAPRNPGYVCQVSGQPAGCGPPDGNAYWSLWWTDGTKGTWTYSSLGAGSLRIPEGGYVAFSWDAVAGDDLPSYTPVRRTTTPSSAPSPTAQPSAPPAGQPSTPSGQGSQQPGSGGAPSGGGGSTTTPPGSGSNGAGSGSGSTTPTQSATPSASASTPATTGPASPTATPTTTPSDTGSPAPGATPSDAVEVLADPVAPTSADSDGDGGGLPGWLAPLLIVLLFGLAGGALLLKRRQGTTYP